MSRSSSIYLAPGETRCAPTSTCHRFAICARGGAEIGNSPVTTTDPLMCRIYISHAEARKALTARAPRTIHDSNPGLTRI